MFKALVVLMFVVSVRTASYANDHAQLVRYWAEKIAQSSRWEFLDALTGAQGSEWPRLRSDYWTTKSGALSRSVHDNDDELAVALIKKLELNFLPTTNNGRDDQAREISRYVLAARRISSNDSYTNLLLADILHGLALYRVSEWLIKNPQDINQVRLWLGEVALPSVDVSLRLRSFLEEDAELLSIPLTIDKVDPERSVFTQLRQAGVPEETYWQILNDPSVFLPTLLLKQPSATFLIGRLGVTRRMFCILQGTVEYLERGGRFTDEAFSNSKAFRDLMGKDARTFAGQLTERSSMGIGDIIFLHQRHVADSPQQRYFLSLSFK